MTITEAARVFRVSERTLWRWIRNGQVAYGRRKGRVILDPVDTARQADVWRYRHVLRHAR